VAAWQGGRQEWRNLIPDQFQVVAREYRGGARQGWFSPAMYRSLASNLTVLMDRGDAANAAAATSRH